MGKVIRFPMQTFFENVYKEVKNRQDDLTRKKIEFLYDEGYKYFLDAYLMEIAKNGKVDFPDWLYLAGIIICKEAQLKSTMAVLDVIKADRVNYCYTKRINEIKEKVKKG